MFGPAKLKEAAIPRRVEIQLCDGRKFTGTFRLPPSAGIGSLFGNGSPFLMVKTPQGEIAINRDTISAILLADDDKQTKRASVRREMEGRQAFQARGPRAYTEPPRRPVRNTGIADPCRILGVRQDASEAELKMAWRRRIKECHPDALAARGCNADAIKKAQIEAANVNAAYRAVLALRTEKLAS